MFKEFRKPMDYPSIRDHDRYESGLEDSHHEEKHLLGMTPAQRFIMALLLLMMTVILGIFFLLENNHGLMLILR